MKKNCKLSFNTAVNTYQIYYTNITTGKTNRKSTGTDNSDTANGIFEEFEKEYNEKLLIHTSQIKDNSKASNLMLNIQEPTEIPDNELKLMDTLNTMLNYYKNQNSDKIVMQSVKRNYSYLIEICGNKKLSEYKMLDFETYKATRLKAKSERNKFISAGTVNCELRNLRAYFSRFLDWEYIIKHPMNKVKYLDNFNKRTEFSDEEMKLIINDTINTKNDLMYYVVNIAYLTGMRLSELINLQWKDIDMENGIIYVRNYVELGFVTKSGRENAIPIESSLKGILLKLKGYDKHNNYVIGKTNGYKYNADFISLSFRNILKKLKIEKYHCYHSLRHTFSCRFLNAGGGIYTLQQILNHSKISTTEKYLHKNLNNMKIEMNSLNLAV
jgi:integrase/recombinase XerC